MSLSRDRRIMHRLTTDLVSQACRSFLSLAYPGGDRALPARKRPLLELPVGQDMFALLESNPGLKDVCQVVRGKSTGRNILLIRLGCGHYPNLKLKAQLFEHEDGPVWLFSVDTHDAFSEKSFVPPPDHPDAAAWTRMQQANASLKQVIEAAWEQAGLTTFNALLRRDLDSARPSPV